MKYSQNLLWMNSAYDKYKLNSSLLLCFFNGRLVITLESPDDEYTTNGFARMHSDDIQSHTVESTT